MLDLFSGIGGFSLAAQWVWGDELEIVAFCECDKFCQKVLQKHWPGVPIIQDVRDVKTELMAFSKGRKSGEQTEQEGWKNTCGRSEEIDLLTGGFPCQPFSVAGKRKGKEDDRFLWPEMFRVIKEIRPRWVVAENVAGIVRMALDDCLSDLEGEGYSTQAVIIPACAVNAPHRRDRIWIIAHDNRSRCNGRSKQDDKDGERICENGYERQADPRSEVVRRDPIGIVANSSRQRLEECFNDARTERSYPKCESHRYGKCRGSQVLWKIQAEGNLQGWWSVEPDVGRVAHGVPNRVDRLKSLGNAIVPQVAMQIFKAIKEINS
jgi:DNA (cytosine-5)-methyltransferase 1